MISFTGADRDALSSRIHLLRHTGSSSDQSYEDRLAQTRVAWDAFEESPLLGVGPGHLFEWVDPVRGRTLGDGRRLARGVSGRSSAFSGCGPSLVLAWAGTDAAAASARAGERTVGQLAIVGLGGAFVSWWALGVPFNDKGFAIGFLLLLALALSEASIRPRLEESASVSPSSMLVVALGIVLALPLVARAVQRRFDPFEPIVVFALAYGVMFVARPASMLVHGDLSVLRCRHPLDASAHALARADGRCCVRRRL